MQWLPQQDVFYDKAEGAHNYSKAIVEIGSRLAIQQVNYDFYFNEKLGHHC